MRIDPVTISLIALVVSIISLLMSSYRAAVDRNLQWEQMRGAIQVRLTARGLDMLTVLEEVRRSSKVEATDLSRKIIRVVDGLVDMRKKLMEMETLPRFTASNCIIRLTSIKSSLDDADIIFDKLQASILDGNLSDASSNADGLLERLYGTVKEC